MGWIETLSALLKWKRSESCTQFIGGASPSKMCGQSYNSGEGSWSGVLARCACKCVIRSSSFYIIYIWVPNHLQWTLLSSTIVLYLTSQGTKLSNLLCAKAHTMSTDHAKELEWKFPEVVIWGPKWGCFWNVNWVLVPSWLQSSLGPRGSCW